MKTSFAFYFAIPLLPVLSSLLATPAAAQAVPIPQIQDSQTQAWLAEMVADAAMIKPNPSAFFTQPAGARAMPCEVPREVLVQLVRAIGLADETPEVRRAHIKSMRAMGMANAAYRYDNLQVLAVKAQCNNDKLDGDIELWATMDRVSETGTFKMLEHNTRRVYFKAVDGKPVGRIRRLTRTTEEKTVFSDPAISATMPDIPVLENWNLEYGFMKPAPNVSYTNREIRGAGGLSQITGITRELPNGVVELTSYKGDKIMMKMSLKDGVRHGLETLYPGMIMNNREMENTCYRNGELYKADPCDVD